MQRPCRRRRVLDGIEFLEFAVDETTGLELAGFLGTLGFRHAGRHRSKSVDLYRHGGINLVLNREQDSAASEHSSCTAPRSARWRSMWTMRRQPWCGRRRCCVRNGGTRSGKASGAFPAVRAPDGTLDLPGQPDPAGPGDLGGRFRPPAGRGLPRLQTVDHVAQALPPGGWTAACCSGARCSVSRPAQLLEMPDPFGLVKPGDDQSGRQRPARRSTSPRAGRRRPALRLRLCRRGRAAHRLLYRERSGDGGGIGGVGRRSCLSCRRITTTIWRHGGVWTIRHSPDLPRDNLLYDREPEGEFIHAYTSAFQDRFFFEFVERGAAEGSELANAGVRSRHKP